MKFDVLTVSELKALCAELGIALGNSAPESEYVAKLEAFFQDANVGEALMALKRDNLKKVARRFSISSNQTKRELTDAILAKVNPIPDLATPDPEPDPVEVEPTPDSATPDPESAVVDPQPEPTKTEETREWLGLPRWVWWDLIIFGFILLASIAFRPRSAPVDLSPIQESIGQVSAKVDNLGQSITDLSGRVAALEAPATVADEKAPAADPEVEDPVAEEPEEAIDTASDNSGVLDGYIPIGLDGYEVFDLVSASDHFEPDWPDGINQTSVGYSTPEEFPDGRSFATRVSTNPDEILVFVARCVEIYGGPKVCHADENGALIGAILGAADERVKLWDAELKTLSIPGGESAWRAYVNELALIISSNKGGAPVEILGAPAQ